MASVSSLPLLNRMEEIKVGHYKNNDKSRYVYLGEAKVKGIEMQPTENRMIGILDIIFKIPLEFREPCEFLFRLETKIDYIHQFLEKLSFAFQNPKRHPNPDDLFQKAVAGSTPRETGEKLIKEIKNKN